MMSLGAISSEKLGTALLHILWLLIWTDLSAVGVTELGAFANHKSTASV